MTGKLPTNVIYITLSDERWKLQLITQKWSTIIPFQPYYLLHSKTRLIKLTRLYLVIKSDGNKIHHHNNTWMTITFDSWYGYDYVFLWKERYERSKVIRGTLSGLIYTLLGHRLSMVQHLFVYFTQYKPFNIDIWLLGV